MVITLAFAVVVVTAYAVAVHRARAAADLAALAAAQRFATGQDACPAAQSVALANGARLTGCQAEGSPYAFVLRVTTESDVSSPIPGLPTTVKGLAVAGNV